MTNNNIFCLIGNCPSSGSTLLADLLDSTDISACGEEMEFFCNKHLYDFNRFKKNIKRTSVTYQMCITGLYPRYEKLHGYGFSEKEFFDLIKNADSIGSFVNNFSEKFLDFRKKNPTGIVFEKTPQNLNCIGEFLDTFPNGYFIFVVRNPLYIYPSMLKRGWGHYISLATWLIDTAKFFPFRNHERILIVKYEDLVKNPFEEVIKILQKIKKDCGLTVEDVKKGYETNLYRKEHAKKLKSWSVQDYGVIKNVNEKILSANELEAFKGALNLKVNSLFAKRFNVADISYKDALMEFGYFNDLKQKIKNSSDSTTFVKKNLADYRLLTTKWARGFFKGEYSFSDLNLLINPVTN